MSSTALGSGDIVAERYHIDGLLGQGGMGSVYRAEQLSMGRSVALKLLATEQPATREQIERFEREAQALARLQHPSTVRLFDFGSVEHGLGRSSTRDTKTKRPGLIRSRTRASSVSCCKPPCSRCPMSIARSSC